MSAPLPLSRGKSENSSTAKPVASPRAERHDAAPGGRHAAKKTAGARKAAPAIKKAAHGGAKDKKAELLQSRLAYKGKVFNVYTDTVKEPSGRTNVRDVIRHNGSVVMLAVDDSKGAENPDVILIRQYRHAAGQYLIELPAGRIDAGEVPLAAAKRELIEETGFRAKKWTLLVKYFASPGFLGEWMQIYLATGLTAGTATPEEDEQIEILRTPLSDAMQLVAGNKIHDGKTLIGLSLFHEARRAGRL